MKNFKVTWEIEVTANTPQEAAEFCQNAMEDGVKWSFFVRNMDTNESTLIDLETNK